MADSWNEDTEVHLRVPTVGASSVVWVNLYAGPKITEDNIFDEAVRRERERARRAAEALAKRWRGLEYEHAREEYDAL